MLIEDDPPRIEFTPESEEFVYKGAPFIMAAYNGTNRVNDNLLTLFNNLPPFDFDAQRYLGAHDFHRDSNSKNL